MTRFPASGGGSGPPYTYVMEGYPDDAEEGESLYHITEDAAYVYTGSAWVEQTVTNHGQLAGVSKNDHHRPVPSGAIMMWSGDAFNVPAGYTLCDGTNGAPDLRNRFIVGAGGGYNSGETGGSESVELAESELPSHSHEYYYDDSVGKNESDGPFVVGYSTSSGGSLNGPSDFAVQASGSDQPHENRPPYYALAFIMKT